MSSPAVLLCRSGRGALWWRIFSLNHELNTHKFTPWMRPTIKEPHWLQGSPPPLPKWNKPRGRRTCRALTWPTKTGKDQVSPFRCTQIFHRWVSCTLKISEVGRVAFVLQRLQTPRRVVPFSCKVGLAHQLGAPVLEAFRFKLESWIFQVLALIPDRFLNLPSLDFSHL